MKRSIIDSFSSWKDSPHRKPLILRGARQVGKTHALKIFGEDRFPRYHYLNFEKDTSLPSIFDINLDPNHLIEQINFRLQTSIDIGKDLLILDEIGYAPRALTALKYFAEEMPDLAICAAGSLLGLQFGESSFPVGKVDFLELHPMSFAEFLVATGEERAAGFLREKEIPALVHQSLWEQFKRYLVVGGLPEVVRTYGELRGDLFTAMEQVRARQETLITAYIADIAKHAGKVNSMHIERVWRHVPATLATGQDGGAPRFKFKGIIPGAQRYSQLTGPIDWLVTAGLVKKVPIVDCARIPLLSHAQENCFKLYSFDVGILGAMVGLSPRTLLEYGFGTYQGYFAENYALQELTAVGVRPLYCWREGTAEIEFLAENDGAIHPLEVKSGWVTRSQSLRVYRDKYRPATRTILSARPSRPDTRYGVHHLPLYLAARFPPKHGKVPDPGAPS